MEEVDVIVLDGKEYAILKEINEYVYLVNTNDEKDITIRKNIKIDGVDYLDKLDSEEELKKALEIFKNNN